MMAETRIQAVELSRQFDANPVAAERKFKGEKLVVTGVVEQISPGIFGFGFAILMGAGMFRGVTASIDDEDLLPACGRGRPLCSSATGLARVRWAGSCSTTARDTGALDAARAQCREWRGSSRS